MAIDPYKGGKCWSCKYCEDVGYYDENLDTVYKRKCTYPGKEYLDYCTKYCVNYIWDGKDTQFNYTCRSVPSGSYYDSGTSSYSGSSATSGNSSTSGSSGSGKGCLIVLVIVAILIGGAFFFLTAGHGKVEEAPKESTSQQTSEDGQKTAVIKHTGNVNLRKKGSSKSDIITSMPPGSTVTVFEETKNWAKVEFEGQQGWCFKKYLDFQD